MASTVQRPTVDIGPHHARPGLALLLAILSLPGSTIAWDLPAGGLWIGLPLGAAAIALALQARRETGPSGSTTAALVLAGLALASMVVFTIVSAVN
jgi:hypothetical protein